MFFSTDDISWGVWLYPWLILVLSTSLLAVVQFRVTFVEACNYVGWVVRCRLYCNLIKQLLFLILIGQGCGLYSLSWATLLYVIVLELMVEARWKDFFSDLKNGARQVGDVIGWYKKIFPFQAKIALSWLCGYFMFSIFNPAIFKICGPVGAGQFGMTFTLLQGVSQLASVWTNTKNATYGHMIAAGKWRDLLDTWRLASIFNVVTSILGCCVIFVFVFFLNKYHHGYGERILSFGGILILSVGIVANQFVFTLVGLMRAFQREPYVYLFLIWGVLTALCAYLLIPRYQLIGACLAYTAPTIMVGLPFSIIISVRELRGRFIAHIV